VDERIRHILPGVGLFRDLQSDVHRLSQRVEELEAMVRKLGGEVPPPAEAPRDTTSTAEE
jgi:polyhydroxyalkanoate synthesis regulator phasin